MDVRVQRINEKGRPLTTKERQEMPKFDGILNVFEAKVTELRRTARIAQLISVVDGTKPAVLPDLHDAEVLSVRGPEIRMRGFEFIDGVQYGQTWDIKVVKC